MLCSTKFIEELVIELAELTRLDLAALSNLIYHLKLPGDDVPRTIAEVLAEHALIGPELIPFPGRLAYGVIDDGLRLYDLAQRYREQRLLCRQVNRIRLHLAELEYPQTAIDQFNDRLSLMIFAASSAHGLAACEQQLSTAEVGVFVEQLLQAMIVQADLTKLLLDGICSRLRAAERNCFALRVREAIRQGLNNVPWDDQTAESVCTVDDPVRFRLSLYNDPRFAEAAWDTMELVNIKGAGGTTV